MRQPRLGKFLPLEFVYLVNEANLLVGLGMLEKELESGQLCTKTKHYFIIFISKLV